MTPARNPLVREIEPKFMSGNCVPVERASITTDEWRRLRAALEAAEEMAEHVGKVTDSPGLWMAAKRYRAATRGEQ